MLSEKLFKAYNKKSVFPPKQYLRIKAEATEIRMMLFE